MLVIKFENLYTMDRKETKMEQDTLLSSAIQSYASGKIEEAETLFRQVLDLKPTEGKALYFLGIIALSKGIADEACRLLYEATLAEPQNKDFMYSLGVALQESGKSDEALSKYEEIDDMPEAQNNMGNIYRQKGELDKARECFDKALEINPRMIWAYLNKALLERQENNQKQAEGLLLKALQIDPDFVHALYQLSIQNRLNKNFNEALQLIEQAVKLTEKVDTVWVEYGKVLRALNRPKDALNAFEKAIELNRFCTDAYFEKAVILEEEDPSASEEAYRNVLRTDPDNIAACNNLGALLYRQNRIVEALEMYRKVFIVKPDDVFAAFNLAVALEDLDNFEEAAGLYFKILGQNQLETEVHMRLANLLPKWFEQDSKKAKTYAEGWVKNFPDNPLAIHTNDALNGKASTEDIDFAYTQTFYNAFADTYEEKMKLLKCQIPELIADKIKNETFKNVLDLGCGTGTCGLFLKNQAENLTGVDISQNMIQKAEEKHIYDKLITSYISDFVRNTKEHFDLIIAADVFCYINKLNKIIRQAHKILTAGGKFIFTVEKATTEKTRLQSSGRYQHPQCQIEKELNDAGFTDVQVQEVVLRQEKGKDCIGLLFIAK